MSFTRASQGKAMSRISASFIIIIVIIITII